MSAGLALHGGLLGSYQGPCDVYQVCLRVVHASQSCQARLCNSLLHAAFTPEF